MLERNVFSVFCRPIRIKLSKRSRTKIAGIFDNICLSACYDLGGVVGLVGVVGVGVVGVGVVGVLGRGLLGIVGGTLGLLGTGVFGLGVVGVVGLAGVGDGTGSDGLVGVGIVGFARLVCLVRGTVSLTAVSIGPGETWFT